MRAVEFKRRARALHRARVRPERTGRPGRPPTSWVPWFAAQVGASTSSVWRWATGASRVPVAAVLTIEKLEAEPEREEVEV
ncbi:MAG: helix-turn-helix domain-containing protein [Chloroflexi bacterium]|nr:helix-turn-helix domain-containing protein [Chloroflexota bacterium]